MGIHQKDFGVWFLQGSASLSRYQWLTDITWRKVCFKFITEIQHFYFLKRTTQWISSERSSRQDWRKRTYFKDVGSGFLAGQTRQRKAYLHVFICKKETGKSRWYYLVRWKARRLVHDVRQVTSGASCVRISHSTWKHIRNKKSQFASSTSVQRVLVGSYWHWLLFRFDNKKT